jgi:hypothetical protein
MADRDATIIAADPCTGDEVRVEARAGRWRWAPVTAAVLVAQTGARGPSAVCTCGHVNFYGHAEHAQAYLGEHPELTGRVLDRSAAVELAGGVFGGAAPQPGLTPAALTACVGARPQPYPPTRCRRERAALEVRASAGRASAAARR